MAKQSHLSMHPLAPPPTASAWAWGLLFLPWLVPLGWLASFGWFVSEDAFISFRYARNLLEGHGLVFNPGEYVEGYSNFLWVLELAALWGAFGLRPEHTAPWLSVACTAGTLAAMLWWVARLPGLPHRGLVGWMAMGLVCSSATFAEWTSGWGLETRQFTLFIVLAVVGLSLDRGKPLALLGVSLSLAAAALTRPEGPLFAACCFAWYAVQRRIDTGRWRPDWRAAAALTVPFVVLVAGHYLFRYEYYGEWLPNTYYAKYVRPWYEQGFPYLGGAAVETGLYLLLPLTILSLGKRWCERRDLTYALPMLCLVLHMGFIARMGGDSFGYRPLDVSWPLLAVSAAEGVVCLGRWAVSVVGRRRPFAPWRLAGRVRAGAIIVFLPVLFYCSAIQAALLFESSQGGGKQVRLPKVKEDLHWLLTAPGMPALIDLHHGLRPGGRYDYRQRVENTLSEWQPYQHMRRGIIPADALAPAGNAGIKPYFLPDLKCLDTYGLTDATIARHPVTRPNSMRWLGHDRYPPPGYLVARGINFAVYPAAASREEALARAVYAVLVGPALWMPFNAPNLDWVKARFEHFAYDTEANRRFKERLKNARLLIRGPYDVYLDGKSLLYVNDRCDGSKADFFLHVVPRDVADLPAYYRQYGFQNLDFSFPTTPQVRVTQGCVAQRGLSDYPIAAVRTGQFVLSGGSEYKRLWDREFRFVEGAEPA